MKVKYLALAVAAACVAPVAQADVTIAGTFAPAMLYSNTGSQETIAAGAGPLVGNQVGSLGGNGSVSTFAPTNASTRFSITSNEDLGDGSNAGAFIDIRGPGGGFSDQMKDGLFAFRYGASIGGGWGKIEVGRDFSPYTWTVIKNDPHGIGPDFFGALAILGHGDGSVVDFAGGAGTMNAFFRTGNGVQYVSPDLSGFSFRASYQVDGTKAAANSVSSTAAAKELSEMGFSADYAPADMPFYVGLAYANRKNANGASLISGTSAGAKAATGYGFTSTGFTGSTDTVGIIGGGVKFGDLKAGIWLEQLKYKTDGVTAGLSEFKRNAFWIPVSYTLPTGVVGATYVNASDASGSATGGFSGKETGGQLFQLTYTHNLSKQTQAHIGWQYFSADKNSLYGPKYGATQNQVVLVLRHSF